MDLKHEFLCQFGSDDVMEIPPPYSKRGTNGYGDGGRRLRWQDLEFVNEWGSHQSSNVTSVLIDCGSEEHSIYILQNKLDGLRILASIPK